MQPSYTSNVPRPMTARIASLNVPLRGCRPIAIENAASPLSRAFAQMIGFLCVTLGLASALEAQDVPQEIRFFTASGAGDRQWQGQLERLTPDSLQLRVRGTDTIAVFSRSMIGSVERQRRVNAGRAASVGCVTTGGALGALGYFGYHDPDSPGFEKIIGALGFVAGCGVGAVGGLVVAAVSGHGWEPWALPESIPSSVPPNSTVS